ncbi:MAG TPA: type II CAAX endopeptidase family protein [Candidatus Udaeobacter sp.]|jgi:membrane protease YdiL (CAAX protease family)
MASDSLFAALGAATNDVLNVFFLFYILASILVYISLIWQISVRTSVPAGESEKRFGLPEAILAAVLVSLLLRGISASVSRPSAQVDARDLLANLLLTFALVLFIVAFLRFRGFDLSSLGGFFKISFLRVLSTGTILLFFAYSLISLSELITQRLFGSGSSKQSIVELFSGSRTIEQRIMIIVFAVAIAPVVEEFLFRFFLYGVLKRYFGRFLGLTVNALLFAAAHTHLPSFVPLFILGSCFTIAYEWSGSILVSMTMHALFNSVSLTALAFPELFPQ